MNYYAKHSSLLIVIIALLLIFGCSNHDREDNLAPIEEPTPPESEEHILELPLPPEKPNITVTKTSILEGSRWKLCEFVKDGQDISINKDLDELCYTLFFYTDSTYRGHTTGNFIYNEYSADGTTNQISINESRIYTGAKDEHPVDFYTYIYFLAEAQNFELSENNLKLSSNEASYMQFNKLEDSDIKSSSIYDCLWQLTSFTDGETGETNVVSIQNEISFYLWFKQNGTFTGRSATNIFNGTYVNNTEQQFLECSIEFITQVDEIYPNFGEKFVNAVSNAHTYTIKNGELNIYSADKSYITLKRL